MTAKHFKAIADTIAKAHMDASAKAALALDMAYSLRDMNPRFDVNKFVKACLPTITD